jgi:lipopolysaccharide export system permease protein
MPRRGAGRTIPRYLLVLTARPFMATLLIVLPALLIERLLRLFDLVASTDAPAGSVGRMLIDLVPHYLGLALPAALFIGIHFVIARLSADNELEAMQNAGLSLAWISRPFLLLGAIAAFGGFGLYGYLEPLSRYAYRAAYQTATEGTWSGVIPPGQIIQVSKNLIVTADASDQATGALSHVFVYQRQSDGKEKLTTGRSGTLDLSEDGTQVVLSLKNGKQMDVLSDNRIDTVSSDSTTMHHPFLLHFATFRGTIRTRLSPSAVSTANSIAGSCGRSHSWCCLYWPFRLASPPNEPAANTGSWSACLSSSSTTTPSSWPRPSAPQA